MNNDFLPRVGTFFLLIGSGFFVLFIGTVFAREFHILYLLFGIAAMSLGFVLRSKAPRPEPARFSGFRKARQRSRQRRVDRVNKKQRNKPVSKSGSSERNRQQREDGTNENQEEQA